MDHGKTLLPNESEGKAGHFTFPAYSRVNYCVLSELSHN